VTLPRIPWVENMEPRLWTRRRHAAGSVLPRLIGICGPLYPGSLSHGGNRQPKTENNGLQAAYDSHDLVISSKNRVKLSSGTETTTGSDLETTVNYLTRFPVGTGKPVHKSS